MFIYVFRTASTAVMGIVAGTLFIRPRMHGNTATLAARYAAVRVAPCLGNDHVGSWDLPSRPVPCWSVVPPYMHTPGGLLAHATLLHLGSA